MLTHRQRLEICLSGEMPDRTPVALWRHFPVDDQSPRGLAAATLNFQRSFDFDLVKYSPASSFCLIDWGCRDEWRGDPEGTRDYLQPVIKQPEDWSKLPLLDPGKGALAAQLDSLKLMIAELGPATPVLQTIFNPLSQAKNLAGKGNLIAQLRQYPDAVHAGLRIITESTIRFIEACLETGIAGVFFAVQHAQYGLLTEAEYQEFGRIYDWEVLEPAAGLWLNMLHLHGLDVMFDQVVDYPVAILNWHDQETQPSLTQGLERFPGVVCGGLRREETLVLGTPDMVRAEAKAAVAATEGKRFILGTGCVTPVIAPYGNLMAARQAVE